MSSNPRPGRTDPSARAHPSPPTVPGPDRPVRAGSTLTRRAFGAGAVTATGMLALSGCGGGSTGDPNIIRIVDYYNTPADDVAINGTFSRCAEDLGLSFSRERVPGDQLIQKVLQMGSSRTLPDLLMLDNPNVQQVAASGALAPLEQYGFTTEGITDSVADLGMHDGTLYGIAPTVNTIALFYNVTMLDDAGVAQRRRSADHRGPLRLRVLRDRQLRGHLPVHALFMVQRR